MIKKSTWLWIAAGLCTGLVGTTQAALTEAEFEQAWKELNIPASAKQAEAKLQADAAQVAPWIIKKMTVLNDADKVDEIITQLDSDDFRTREEASTRLQRLGRSVEPNLRVVLAQTRSSEVKVRVQELLDLLNKKPQRGEEKVVVNAPPQDAIGVRLIASTGADALPNLQKIQAKTPWDTTRNDAQTTLMRLVIQQVEQRTTELEQAIATQRSGDARKALDQIKGVLAAAGMEKNTMFDAALQGLAAKIKMAETLDALQAKIAANPQDNASRETLARLLLINLGQPIEAQKVLTKDCDAKLVALVELLMKPVKDLTLTEHVALADGLMAEIKAPTAENTAMAKRAWQSYRAAVNDPKAKPLQAQYRPKLDSLEVALMRLGVDLPDVMNVASVVDLTKHVAKGEWKKTDKTLEVEKGTFALLNIPFQPEGGYEWSLRVTRLDGEDGIFIAIPVAGATANLNLGGWANTCSGLETIGGVDAQGNQEEGVSVQGGIENNKPQDVVIRVEYNKEKAEAKIVVTMNGKPFCNWTGATAQLGRHSVWRTMTSGNLAIGAYQSKVRFENFRLVPLDAMIKLLKDTKVDKTADEPAAQEAELRMQIDQTVPIER
jgi:hypothetical protein